MAWHRGLGRWRLASDLAGDARITGSRYGIRLRLHGMFKQNIVDGRQKESPVTGWNMAAVWEFKRATIRAIKSAFGEAHSARKVLKSALVETEILAVAYDQISPVTTPTPLTHCGCGMRRPVVKSASIPFNPRGDYFAAVEDKSHSENVFTGALPGRFHLFRTRTTRLRGVFLVSATVRYPAPSLSTA